MMTTVVAWGIAAALLRVAAWQGGGDSAVTVRPVRFFSPGTGVTVIEGTSEIRLIGLAPASAPTTRYRVEIVIADSSGLELVRNDWTRELPTVAARAAGATAMESFHFAAAPGRYRITVRASSDGGAALERVTDIGAFAARPLVSDLLLATAAREAADSASPLPGEIRRGRWVLRTGPVPHLTFGAAALTYYTEIYPWPGFAGGTAQLNLEVVTDAGRTLVRAAPQQLRVGATGGVARGTMDLAGLPEGSYRVRATVVLQDTAAAVESAFSMGPDRPTVALGPAPAAAAGSFNDLSEETLDSLYSPLAYLLEPNERGVYENLEVAGKRRFLAEFWRHRDPTPATPDNPLQEAFYRGVRHANQAYREGGGAQIPGWRTDRGRVYLKYGEPTEVFRRPQAHPRAFEVWLYTHGGRGRYYAFYDATSFGHYVLAGTNDVVENAYDHNVPFNWIRGLTTDSQLIAEVMHFIQR
ncbi:MAG: GWxTD domain-containing protein [Gemmatimonadetes bacterium]|nr:GWxTD domain-containing protein [Gemmatimonadota bacterium]